MIVPLLLYLCWFIIMPEIKYVGALPFIILNMWPSINCSTLYSIGSSPTSLNSLNPTWNLHGAFNINLIILFHKPEHSKHHKNDRECLRTATNVWRSFAGTAFVSPFAIYSPQCETSITQIMAITLDIHTSVFAISSGPVEHEWRPLRSCSDY